MYILGAFAERWGSARHINREMHSQKWIATAHENLPVDHMSFVHEMLIIFFNVLFGLYMLWDHTNTVTIRHHMCPEIVAVLYSFIQFSTLYNLML